MPYAALSPARFGLLCRSSTGFAVLASLLFVGMAPPSLAQSPLAIPSNRGSAPLLASGPPRVTVHPRPHFYRRCTRWYLVQYHARRRFQALCGISGCLFRTRARHSPAGKARLFSGSMLPVSYPRASGKAFAGVSNLRGLIIAPSWVCIRNIVERQPLKSTSPKSLADPHSPVN